jgi:endoglycosylceramidase
LAIALAANAALACGSKSSGPSQAKTCSLSAPAPADWRLQADGTVLRDSLGRVVFLRGVNAGGRSKMAPYVPFDYATGQFATELTSYMDRAASWGIDAMRVPFVWAALEPTQGQHDTDWLSQYQQLLAAAWARGIWTVVDFHQDLYSASFCGDGFPVWTEPNPPAPQTNCTNWSFFYLTDTPMRQAFDLFWAAGSTVQASYLGAWDFLLATFKDQPGVLGFEPINEPGWGNASDVDVFESTTLTSFYAQVAPHFRQQAPQSLVFIDPTSISGTNVATKLQRPPGDGIVFAPHYYPPLETPGGAEAQIPNWAAVGAAWNTPTVLGEFGVNVVTHPNAAAYIAGCFGALDTLGMSGMAWEYSVAPETWNGEMFSFVAADGTENATVAALLRPYARAVAGSAIAQSWDAPSGTFVLTYTAASGITEVQLPSRAYPAGYDVDVSGGCYDEKASPGRLLVKADTGAKSVSLKITPHATP